MAKFRTIAKETGGIIADTLGVTGPLEMSQNKLLGKNRRKNFFSRATATALVFLFQQVAPATTKVIVDESFTSGKTPDNQRALLPATLLDAGGLTLKFFFLPAWPLINLGQNIAIRTTRAINRSARKLN